MKREVPDPSLKTMKPTDMNCKGSPKRVFGTRNPRNAKGFRRTAVLFMKQSFYAFYLSYLKSAASKGPDLRTRDSLISSKDGFLH